MKSYEDEKMDNIEEKQNKNENSEDLRELEEKIQSLEAKQIQLQEEKDKYLRASANLQNMYNELKEQVKKDIERTIKREQLNFLDVFISFREMLLLGINSVKDTINATKDNSAGEEGKKILNSLLDGIDMVDRSMMSTMLSKYQLEETNCNIMDEFNYDIHDAKQNIITDKKELNNKIARVIKKGYKNKDIIIKTPTVEVYQYLQDETVENEE